MKAFDFAVPVKGSKVPDRPTWFHEINRLLTEGGIDYSSRYPWIVESARLVRQKRFALDGEAVLLGVDGISDFDGLHSGKSNADVQFYAFDCLMDGGDDLRRLPLSMRKLSLERLLARRADGIFVAPFESGEIGPDHPLRRMVCGSPRKAGSKRLPSPPRRSLSRHDLT
jgi:bifunctional non-homologous end joining protein LigD